MRALAKYSTLALAGLTLFNIACRDTLAPDSERPTLEPNAIAAARKPVDRAPTAPSSLRITETGARSVSLAWNPSTDDSGVATYRIVRSGGYEIRVPGSQTTFTWTSLLHSSQTYTFYVYAVDAAGNKSKASNTVTVTLPPDTQAPTAPVLSATNVGATHITLAWSATDDDGTSLSYSITINGSPDPGGTTSSTSRTYSQLQPATSYTFTVQARDNGGNQSAVSEPLTVTTRASDFTDTEAPSVPTNVWAVSYSDGSTEFQVTWNMSTDNVDPQSKIRYEVYVNGALENTIIGIPQSNSNYGVWGTNSISVIAIDAAGNRSAPGTTTLELTQ